MRPILVVWARIALGSKGKRFWLVRILDASRIVAFLSVAEYGVAAADPTDLLGHSNQLSSDFID